jgi:hypothetical protein
MIGLCHSCYSSGITNELDQNSVPICISYREELAATKRKEVNER